MSKKTSSAQIVLFPLDGSSPADSTSIPHPLESNPASPESQQVAQKLDEKKRYAVLSGTYRKDPEGLRGIYEELRDGGCEILSPSNIKMVREVDGFVYMEGEETQSPETIELRHLRAIERADFVWLHAPDGYVGPSAALEVGFARANRIPVFTSSYVKDETLRSFINVVQSPQQIFTLPPLELAPPSPAVQAFQNYYKRVAVQRGYDKEDAQACLLLMVEEVGELARAIRKREKLQRHGPGIEVDESHELADVFLYVVHMANILELDLAKAVQQKELLNLKRFLRERPKK